MRISDWSSDVCSSDLLFVAFSRGHILSQQAVDDQVRRFFGRHRGRVDANFGIFGRLIGAVDTGEILELSRARFFIETLDVALLGLGRSEEHTSELQSLMRTSYAVFCLKKKTTRQYHT